MTATGRTVAREWHLPDEASTGSAYLQDRTDDLDELLERVAATLQLTSTHYRLAEDHYLSVTDWLSATASPLSKYDPHLYPQGSMALLTTVRPWKSIEYDLDIICRLAPTGWGPERVYEAIYARLAENETYRPKLERLKRCIRLNYAGDFHLDVIPAEPDLAWGGTSITIPDLVMDGGAKIWRWKTSNPLGYIEWFHARANTSAILEKRHVDPMPPHVTAAENSVLATVVQLIKRYRDVRFRGADTAPRSIILTTLAGHAYRGTQRTSIALCEIVNGIADMVRAAAPQRVVVANPTNAGEQFCDKFTDESYEAFREFVFDLERLVTTLIDSRDGFPALRSRLDGAFGSDPVEKAFESYGKQFRTAKDQAALRVSASTGLLIADAKGDGQTTHITQGRTIPSHRFSGEG